MWKMAIMCNSPITLCATFVPWIFGHFFQANLINHPHRPILAKSEWWVCRKVVVKHSINKINPSHPTLKNPVSSSPWVLFVMCRIFGLLSHNWPNRKLQHCEKGPWGLSVFWLFFQVNLIIINHSHWSSLAKSEWGGRWRPEVAC